MAYARHSTVPAYVHGQCEGGMPIPSPTGLPRWYNAAPVPAIGTVVEVTMNRIGMATVTGYFVEEGFLGLIITIHNPPEWHRKANRDLKNGHVFGTEIRFLEA